jgi:hypothetical protein
MSVGLETSNEVVVAASMFVLDAELLLSSLLDEETEFVEL